MWTPSEDILKRASDYANRRGAVLQCRLGYGVDGTIFSTSSATAIKTYFRREPYERELACYRRLSERQVVEVLGHHVPQLVGWDDALLVIEMTVVTRPFLLDFAAAQLDAAPDFPDEVLKEWYEEKREQFGSNWEKVGLVMAFLRGHYGIYLLDVNPGNITFESNE